MRKEGLQIYFKVQYIRDPHRHYASVEYETERLIGQCTATLDSRPFTSLGDGGICLRGTRKQNKCDNRQRARFLLIHRPRDSSSRGTHKTSRHCNSSTLRLLSELCFQLPVLSDSHFFTCVP
jgi:hypothetical protein